jgi:hypothetical protein
VYHDVELAKKEEFKDYLFFLSPTSGKESYIGAGISI